MNQNDVLALASCWGAKDFQLVNAGINFVYICETPNGKSFLKIADAKRNWSVAAPMMQHAILHGANISAPVLSLYGNFVEQHLGQDGANYFATATQEVPGVRLGSGRQNMNSFVAWGKTLAVFHRAVDNYPNPQEFPKLQKLWQRIGPHVQQDGFLEKEYKRLSFNTESEMFQTDVGITHLDARPGNAFFDGEQAYLIDFDEPCLQPRIMDVARAMLEYADWPMAERIEVRDAFLRGYLTVRDLPPNQLENLHLFMQIYATLSLAWFLEDGVQVTQDISGSTNICLAWRKHLGNQNAFQFYSNSSTV